MKKLHKISTIVGLTGMVFFGCSLDEKLRQNVDRSSAQQFLLTDTQHNFNALLATVYTDMQTFESQDKVWCLQEHSSDELIPPTRAANWEDGGNWRALHAQRWDADHAWASNSFNDLLTGVYDATVILGFPDVTPDVAAKARFLRAFILFHVLDNWGQFPFRDPNSDPYALPKVYNSADGTAFLISEVEGVMGALADGPLPGQPNKDAARMLLAKLYLNKGTFLNRQSPTFDAADMDKVILYTTQIIDGGAYHLTDQYFDNFAPQNDTKSSELIFTIPDVQGVGQSIGNGMRSRWFSTLHYAQNPSGWNGFATLADFYDKFSANDLRKSYQDPAIKAVGGPDLGFLVGQQTDKNNVPLVDAGGKPVVFNREVTLIENGPNLDFDGIRVNKYAPDYSVPGNNANSPDNDYVLFRYADALLMRAEANLRKGNSADALTDVNTVRNKRIEPDAPLSSLTLDDLLDERGRELYWEGFRRQDLIRFGKFLSSRPTKPYESDPRYLLYAIPNAQLAVNPNLHQNPGF